MLYCYIAIIISSYVHLTIVSYDRTGLLNKELADKGLPRVSSCAPTEDVGNSGDRRTSESVPALRETRIVLEADEFSTSGTWQIESISKFKNL